MKPFVRWFIVLALLIAAGGITLGQRMFSRGPSGDRSGVPNWELDRELPRDVFTFVRIRYSSTGGYGYRGDRRWAIDYPDAEINLSWRLHQMTSMKVHPDGIVLELTDPELFNYPFIYIVEPGALEFTEEEVKALRRYLLNGGFLMVDDFWGEREWQNFYDEIKRVFPEREPVELPIEHPIFSIVFPLKEKPQLPSIGHVQRYRGTPYESYERPERGDTQEVHYKGIFDDKGRMMAIICHNTDLGDGWEREGEDEYYFRNYSEPKAYPMGINIIFYALTH
jgi:hypothetical protein